MSYSIKEDVKNRILPSFLQSNILLYCVVLLLTLKIVTTLVFINFPQNIFFADITKFALENFVNQTRESLGLQPLSENEKLNKAAILKAENMVQNQYFDHTSPSGVTPWFWFLKAGYNYKYAGENLAIGFFDSKEVYQAWLNSPSHRANILNSHYTEVGTAVISGFGPNNAIVVVQEFGTQLPAKTAVKPKTPTGVATTPEVKNPTVAPSPVAVPDEKVLSQSIEFQGSIEYPSGKGADNLPSRFLNFFLYNYDGLLQNIIYGAFLIVIGILLALIFFNLKIGIKRELVFRAILIIVLLSAAALFNKEVIISLTPHQVII